MPQVKVGWRSGAVAAPSVSTILLDAYSGAAAAYSLRKLSSTYTGSAIRVRRSSDNTELNIGFDANGDLDTYALSAFVGTGNGFVTTWYDQSGNLKNATQVTAAYQPLIVSGGVIYTLNGKPVVRNPDTRTIRCMNVPFPTLQSRPVSIIATGKIYQYPANPYGNTAWYLGGDVNAGGGSRYEFVSSPTGFAINRRGNSSSILVNNGTNATSTFIQQGHFASGTITNRLNGVDVFSAVTDADQFTANSNFVIIGANSNYQDFMPSIGMYEYIFYFTDKTSDRAGIESNINSYYSVYPNPTSVWNLLAAAYNADATGSSSLKTSLVAAYNGESNANDSFGSNNGTANGGVTYTAGKIGDAFQFNGSTSYVSLPNDSLNFTGDFTVNAWFNTSTYTGLRGIASSYKVVGSLAYGWIANHDDSTNRFGLYFRDGSNTMLYRTYAGVPTNSYHMITWVRKVGQDPKIYINGVLSPGEYTFGNSSSNPSYQTGQPCNLGGWNNTSYGNHKQDATNFWSKALTISEITELYNSGNGAQYIGDNFYKPTPNDALNTYNGTAQGGLTYGLGKVGTAFQFNGTNAYVQLGDVMDVGLSSWSYSMWFNSSQLTSGNYYTLFSKSIAASLVGRVWMTMNGNKIEIGFDVASGQFIVLSTVSTFNTNTWYHVVYVLDRSDKLKLYVNGIAQTLTTTNGNNNLIPYSSSNYNTNNPFRIGSYTSADNTTPFALFNGSIDAFNAWNKVLTQSEITELYNSGNGKQYPN